MNQPTPFPIGTPGQPWSNAEKAQWRAQQIPRRSYQDEVISAIQVLGEHFEVVAYGELDYRPERYRLYALRSKDWNPALPSALVTGGVHGYETSGVHGALEFVRLHALDYAGRINLLVVPCVSPWAYERIQRWNADALDPNRAFRADSPAQESAALMALAAPLADALAMHIDLHETTDSDETEFRPALAARDGVDYEPDSIPDGFYLVGDTQNPQPAFQQAVIDAVSRVTHIAPADANGQIIGSPVVAPGVINYDFKRSGLCAGMTNASYTTTTEVYPDSPRATSKQCNTAQATAVRAALDHALAQSGH